MLRVLREVLRCFQWVGGGEEPRAGEPQVGNLVFVTAVGDRLGR